MSVESREEVSNWRELREVALLRAKELISDISHFEGMSEDEQIEALKALEESLTNNNENRYVAKEVARERVVMEEIRNNRARMARYGIEI